MEVLGGPLLVISALLVVAGAVKLRGSPWAGATIGAVFGVVRFATMLWVRSVDDPVGLRDAIARTHRWLPMAKRVAVSSQGVAAIVLLAAL